MNDFVKSSRLPEQMLGSRRCRSLRLLRGRNHSSKIVGGRRGIDFVEIQVLALIYNKPRSYFDDDELSATGEEQP